MLVHPQTLSLITTHQCTAACDHCCFTCTPKVTKAIPYERLLTLIDEASELKSMKVIVFTGGECFLLGKELDSLIEHATTYNFITRCVTNGYWATSSEIAEKRIENLVDAGLKEINFSTGSFHAQYVPVDRIIYGAVASLNANITTVINIEECNESDFDADYIIKNTILNHAPNLNRLKIQRNVWIENDGSSKLTHLSENSRFNEDRKSGCSTALNVLSVTPDLDLVACCGLHLEKIPELHLGSVKESSIVNVLTKTPDDFLKIWIHTHGPERILEFVKKYVPDYELPVSSVHPCETCLHLYSDKKAQTVILEHYHEVEDEVVTAYLSGLAIGSLKQGIDESLSQDVKDQIKILSTCKK
jgi:MoaA/NifB/PqqE/SkfB family radical SAM enzyme